MNYPGSWLVAEPGLSPGSHSVGECPLSGCHALGTGLGAGLDACAAGGLPTARGGLGPLPVSRSLR